MGQARSRLGNFHRKLSFHYVWVKELTLLYDLPESAKSVYIVT